MNIIVIYKSRTGFTKKYAEWIQGELKCEIADYGDINRLDLDRFDIVIYGGRVHAGKIDCLGKVKKLVEGKKCYFVVFATGATPVAATEEIEKMMASNFSENAMPHFYMQSGLCYEKMGFADKNIMKLFSKMLQSKANKSDVESGIATAIRQSHDISDKSYIKPLIDCVKKYGRQ